VVQATAGTAGIPVDGDSGTQKAGRANMMRSFAITGVEAVPYPVLRVVFEDGLAGELDMS
jgi:hypothetical protein